MVNQVKKIVVNLLWKLFGDQIRGNYSNRFFRRLYLAHLHEVDVAVWRVEIARSKGVKIGDNCRLYSMNFFSEPNLVEIGNDVIVSGEVKFITHDGGIHLLKDEIPNVRGNYGRIKIGDNCFIGMSAIICQNVQIGNNSIVAAGAVVLDSFPEGSIIMGNPAKVVFKFDMYRKMKKKSPYTLTLDEYPYPQRISLDDRLKLVADKIAGLEIKKPKRARKR